MGSGASIAEKQSQIFESFLTNNLTARRSPQLTNNEITLTIGK